MTTVPVSQDRAGPSPFPHPSPTLAEAQAAYQWGRRKTEEELTHRPSLWRGEVTLA